MFFVIPRGHIGIYVPEIWNTAPWELGLADPVERRMRHVPNLVVLDQTVGAYIRTTEIRRKTDPKRPAFQRHSMYLEPTRIDRLPMTSC